MKNYLLHDEWKIIEEGFNPEFNEVSESCFSIGNGRFGQRANFEEQYSGKSLQGSYVAGVYYPDKTRVGWWKNGYPEYFAKVLNAPNWIGIDVQVDGEVLDIATGKVLSFRRELDMKRGLLIRQFKVRMVSGKELEVKSTRFCSMANVEVGAMSYEVKPINFSGQIQSTPYIDADVVNQDANWDEKFWSEIAKDVRRRSAYVTTETKKTAFQICTGFKFSLSVNGIKIKQEATPDIEDKYIGLTIAVNVKKGDKLVLNKYAGITSSRYYPNEKLMQRCREVVNEAFETGFKELVKAQEQVWADKWKEADITIEGDIAAQQAIRFNIFQLYQTYTGDDPRLNIGPKGFTGEKYGGSTYWDTEAYCLPFYLATADQSVARNLLVYRFRHLEKAIENAQKLGFTNGAALYPMVTMNGEECHNEWEITFEEIHRNGAIAFAIYDYIRYTGDRDYLQEFGLEVLIGIARFWAQRVHWSEPKQRFVMHGVTGPNEYENNVNNNWYTNYLAAWCLKYAAQACEAVEKQHSTRYGEIIAQLHFDEKEKSEWKLIAEKMFLPFDDAKGIFLQQEGFLDKEIRTVDSLKPEERPINQNWSWDRILRSCFIKQADVLQGLYFFEDEFDEAALRRNFEFYEPLTVHESSLSACVHAIIASRLGMHNKAYEMYLRTARLDLDDYNNDTEDGLHITSMAGTWMALVEGFGGMRAEPEMLAFDPHLPEKWNGYAFHVRWRNHIIKIQVGTGGATIENIGTTELPVKLRGKVANIPANAVLKF